MLHNIVIYSCFMGNVEKLRLAKVIKLLNVNFCSESNLIFVTMKYILIFEENDTKSLKRRFWILPSLQAKSKYSGSKILQIVNCNTEC